MIPFSCSEHNCFQLPSKTYTINNQVTYNCVNHNLKCRIKKCNKVPKMCYRHNKLKLYYCSSHGKQYIPTICHKQYCSSIAIYNYADKPLPWYCVKHRLSNMDIVTSKCSFVGCHNDATYNFIGRMKELINPKGMYCHHHKKTKMVSVDDFNDGYYIKNIQLTPIIEPDINEIINTPQQNNINDSDLMPTISIIYDIRKDKEQQLQSILNTYQIVDIHSINIQNLEHNDYEIIEN